MDNSINYINTETWKTYREYKGICINKRAFRIVENCLKAATNNWTVVNSGSSIMFYVATRTTTHQIKHDLWVKKYSIVGFLDITWGLTPLAMNTLVRP